MNKLLSTVFLSVVSLQVIHAQLDCIDPETGNLLDGKFVENGVCVEDSVWYYELSRPVIASNGLQEGAPTHFQLYFGCLNRSIADAFDPQCRGLKGEDDFFELKVELSPHFIYNDLPQPEGALPAQPLYTTELAIAPANILYNFPCLIENDSIRGEMYCSGWDSQHGTNKNEIIVYADQGLYGQRALQVGIKFFHLHPVLNENRPIYWNANGTCNETLDDDVQYCRLDSDCSVDTATCVAATEPLVASVTATVYRKDGSILHKGTRTYPLDREPRYHIAASNTGLACVTELTESVDFQRARPYQRADRFERICPSGGNLSLPLFSEGVPYAPRFYLFGPNGPIAFPGAPIEDFGLVKTSDTTGEVYTGTTKLGDFFLTQPEGANATILEDELGWSTANSRFQGALFGIPIQLGEINGKYTVTVKLLEGGQTLGATASSTTIVEGGIDPDDDSGAPVIWQILCYLSILFLWWI